MATSDSPTQAVADLVRVMTCGSVDDGKSTLIGRLLYESQAVFADHLTALEADSRKHGTQGDQLDLALLLDGLQAEREQGITIDVAYRHITTDKRRFILADSPGHEQYTRNMATAASTADIAIILIDARKGVLPQTRRHLVIATMLGVEHLVVAVNKMDLVDWSSAVFDAIRSAVDELARSLGCHSVTVIPVSALSGDNVIDPSSHTPWYRRPGYSGSTVLQVLETLPVHRDAETSPLRMPVQTIIRPHQDFRGVAGTIAAGTVRIGDSVRILPSGIDTTVTEILTPAGAAPAASAGDAVTLSVADDIDVVRGDVLCTPDSPAGIASAFQAQMVWMHDEPLLPGRTYLVKLHTRTVSATFQTPRYRLESTTLDHVHADAFHLNDIGVCTFTTSRPLVFDPYAHDRTMGGFIVIDRYTNATVGAGMITHALRRSDNVQWQTVDIDKAARAQLAGHRSAIVWLTGLSGSGKSTIANALERTLHASGVRTYLLDGDNIRHGLNKDLGFTPEDRVENIRRVGEVARLLMDAGVVVICAFISPYTAERDMVRAMVEPDEFFEVFVDVPLAVAENRDPKGLYAKARSGQITNFTGIDAPYEPPTSPDLHIDSTRVAPDDAAGQIRDLLTQVGILPQP